MSMWHGLCSQTLQEALIAVVLLRERAATISALNDYGGTFFTIVHLYFTMSSGFWKKKVIWRSTTSCTCFAYITSFSLK